jgi:hypothetical protein
MATHDDQKTVVRMRPKSTLLPDPGRAAAVRQMVPEMPPDTGAEVPAMDELDPLPGPGDPYKAYGRAENKPLLTLSFLKDSAVEGFAYSDLRRMSWLPADTPSGRVLMLRFVESVTTEVLLDGRNLELMHANLCRHRIPWVRMLPPGKMLSDKNAEVVTDIKFHEVKS